MKWILTILVSIMLLIPSVSSVSGTISNDVPVTLEKLTVTPYGNPHMMWITQWVASDPVSADYGKGRFFYRLSRSVHPIGKRGYLYQVWFISDSYYDSRYYIDSNGDGIADVYRASTKIDRVDLFVNGKPYYNELTDTEAFWLLFNGNFETGEGELGISFLHESPGAKVFITWTKPYPF